MPYTAEVIRRARARLDRARNDRESQNRAHLADAYARFPRLREIDRQLQLTMAKAAQAVFARGGDAEAAMNQARRENLALQKEREALVSRHFEPGYLDDAPVCPHCGGTGYIGSTMCSCLQALCRQEQRNELTVLNAGGETFAQFRLDYYPDRIDPGSRMNIRSIMEKTFQKCKKYAMTFSEKSENLLFSGATGLGKTFLSACIARSVADGGHSVVYESAPRLFAREERARFGSDEEARREVEKYTACDLLIMDDLGTEMPGQFTTSTLYQLINDRLLAGKPTIISTNLNSEDLSRRYSPQIASRLRGCYTRVAFLGDDIRLLKNRG